MASARAVGPQSEPAEVEREVVEDHEGALRPRVSKTFSARACGGPAEVHVGRRLDQPDALDGEPAGRRRSATSPVRRLLRSNDAPHRGRAGRRRRTRRCAGSSRTPRPGCPGRRRETVRREASTRAAAGRRGRGEGPSTGVRPGRGARPRRSGYFFASFFSSFFSPFAGGPGLGAVGPGGGLVLGLLAADALGLGGGGRFGARDGARRLRPSAGRSGRRGRRRGGRGP